MDTVIQWCITTALAIIGLLAGRYWGFHDRLYARDKKVYEALLTKLPSNGSILFIREHNFGNSFEVGKLNDLYIFEEFALSPEYHFVDKKLETLRMQLVKDASIFNSYLGSHTWRISNDGSRRNKMKSPEEFNSDQEYRKEKEKINNLSTQVCNTYDSLIKTASKKGF